MTSRQLQVIPREVITYRGDLLRYRYLQEIDVFATFKANGARAHMDQLINWRRKHMANRTFTLELKLDFPVEDVERYNAAKAIAIQAARDLLAATTLLMPGDKAPSIAMFTEDHFFDQQKIALFDANGEPTEVTADSPVDGTEDGKEDRDEDED